MSRIIACIIIHHLLDSVIVRNFNLERKQFYHDHEKIMNEQWFIAQESDRIFKFSLQLLKN